MPAATAPAQSLHHSFSDRFRVLAKLGEGAAGVVYECLDEKTGEPVAIKTLHAISPEQTYWLKSEFRSLADVHHPNLLRFGELFLESDHCYFTMELLRGTNFLDYVRPPEPISGVGPRGADNTNDRRPAEALDAAPAPGPSTFDEARLRACLAQLALAVATVHDHGLVHRDLKPSNVMVEPSGRVVVLDFGIAGAAQHGDAEGEDGMLGTPAYMAPEQVLGEPAAGAADWYAFGVMLFQSLTGRLPFDGANADILQAKVTDDAPRPSSLVGAVPPDLDALCADLLSIDAEQRPTDNEVIERLARGTTSAPRAAARTRAARGFVGRTEELEQLRRAFTLASSGRFAGVLIEGPPGTGKTELVEAFVLGLRDHESPPLVLRGRCYEQESVPLKGFDALLDALSHYLKGLPDEDARTLLPVRPALIAALFPVLYRVGAIAAAIPPLELNESKPEQRGEAVVQLAQLFAAVARRRSLVLFLDDLQWAGEDSFALMHELFSDALAPPVLLIATGRTTDDWEHRTAAADDSDTARARPAFDVVADTFARIHLQPLSSADASALLRQISPEVDAMDAARVAHLLSEAAGHPLLLQELARYARDGSDLGGELRLDRVLAERIRRLDPESRRLLEASAVAGVPSPAQVLGRVARVEGAELSRALAFLRSEQLIRVTRSDGNRTIVPYHDRVREAVVQGALSGSLPLACQADVACVHLELGRQLLRARVEDGLPITVATVAHHYNLGGAAITSPEERATAAQLCLDAAKQMKLASAYAAASRQIDSARQHLESAAQEATRELQRAADLLDMEVALLSDRAEHASRCFDRLVAGSQNDLELAKVYEARVAIETAKNQLPAAVATAREGLGRLAMSFPRRGSTLQLLVEIALLEWGLRGRTPASLIELPIVRDDRVRAQMQLLMSLTPAAYFSDVPLMSIALVRIARNALTRGLTAVSAFGFMGYALVLAGAFQKYRRAFEFGLLGQALNERFQNRTLDAKLVYLQTFTVCPYVRPIEESWPEMKRAQALGLANGDLNFRTYAAVCTPMLTLSAGGPLSQMKDECLEGVRVGEQEGNVDMTTQTHWRLRAIRCLQGDNDNPLRMDGETSEQELLHATEQVNLGATNFCHGLMQAVLGCHFDDPVLATQGARRAARYAHAQFGLVTLIDLCFYRALATCATYARLGRGFGQGLRALRLRIAIQSDLRKLAKWAASNELNYASHYLLVRGEYRRVVGQQEEARRDLEEASARAERRRTHNVAALAHERLAAWHEASGSLEQGRASLEAAVAAYRRWGAEACVARLSARLDAGTTRV